MNADKRKWERQVRGILLVWLLFDSVAGAADFSPQEIKAVRKLYIGKCAKCHKLHDPTTYADSQWAAWMKKMTRKARLTPEQEQLLTRYLDMERAQR